MDVAVGDLDEATTGGGIRWQFAGHQPLVATQVAAQQCRLQLAEDDIIPLRVGRAAHSRGRRHSLNLLIIAEACAATSDGEAAQVASQ